MLNRTESWVLIAVIVAGTTAGCTQTSRSDYESAGHKATSAAGDAGKAISADATAIGHSIRDAAGSGSKVVDRASVRVSDAILEATDIQTNDLKVTAHGNTMTLSGTVLTEVQNQRAEHLARTVLGPGYIVDDKLIVDGRI